MLLKYLRQIFKDKKNKFSNYLNLDERYTNIISNKSSTDVNQYHHNVIIYRCVNLISQSASHIPWIVYTKNHNNLVRNDLHPVNRLLFKPNPFQSGADLFATNIANKMLYGNSYLLLISNEKLQPREIHILESNNVDILSTENKIIGYKYRLNSNIREYYIDQITNQSAVLHLKNYNPSSPIKGVSCLSAASIAIDIHNRAGEWNDALLRNGARPSGALIVKDNSGYLSEEQFERLREQLYEKYTSSTNSGKPLLLEGGLDWKEMSISPKDMDFIECKNSAAREIALAFGVPPQLLGINGDNTYSNMQEARLALWEETIIPLLDNISDSLSNWLSHWFKEEILITFNKDAISALTQKRENLWEKVSQANFITINEKRALFGLPPMKNCNNL